MKFRFSICLALCLGVFINSNAWSAETSWSESQVTKTRLILNRDQQNKRNLIAIVEFEIKSGWKIDGNPPSEASKANSIGLPPSFDFSESKNYSKHTVHWPKPVVKEEKIGSETFKYYVYENKVEIPIAIELKNPAEISTINLKLNYGACKEVCIPVETKFSLNFDPKTADTDFSQEDVSRILRLSGASKISLFTALLIAFLGGAILNIMPCVLPVLSIKLISIIKHRESENSHIRLAFFATILGIASCFLAFASAASAVKATSHYFGWGLQFQNPYFLIFLILVLTFMICNLLGKFEIDFSRFLSRFLVKITPGLRSTEHHQVQYKNRIELGNQVNIFVANFLSGILAVLLATPCSAPFLGSAISFALTQEIQIIFLVLLIMGLGFASPYLVLIAIPDLVRLLPKPGKWMLVTKDLMIGFLVATVSWLLYVLSGNLGLVSAIVAAIAAFGIWLGFKITSRTLRIVAITIVTFLAFALPISIKQMEISAKEVHNKIWRKFDEEEIYTLVAKGKVVVVDVTADWCITCKLNKLMVLNSSEIVALLSQENVVAMRADITRPDKKITEFMSEHNRFAIPFNIVYGPNAQEGLLASELLNKNELIKLIKSAQ